MERIVEIFAHYGKNDGNVIFCYFTVQRRGLTLRSESWPALSTRTVLIQKSNDYDGCKQQD